MTYLATLLKLTVNLCKAGWVTEFALLNFLIKSLWGISATWEKLSGSL